MPYILDKCFSYLCVFQDTDPVADPAARWGTEKREIYAAASGGHLFYDLFLQGWGSMPPSASPWIRYWDQHHKTQISTF